LALLFFIYDEVLVEVVGAEQMVFYYDAIFQALLQLVAPAVLHDDVVEVVALHGDVVVAVVQLLQH
jgi:hypothetical protein